MSTYTIVALVVLPILGGVIAWMGDVIGYRLGKSRRSLFSLRPRSTARLVAVVIGVVLPLLTMLVAAVGSKNVRVALFELEQLQTSRTMLEAQNQTLKASADTLRQQKTRAQAEAAEAEQKVRAAGLRLQTAQQRLRAAEARVRQIDANLREAQAKLAGAQDKLQTAQQQLQASEEELQRIRVAQEAMAAQVAELRIQRDAVLAQADQARRDLEKAQRDYEDVKGELEAKQAELRTAQASALGYLGQWFMTSQMGAIGRVRYEPGTEIVRTLVSSNQTDRQLASSLAEIMVVASAKAAAQGVRLNPETGWTVTLVAPLPPGKPDFPPESPDEVIQAVAQVIKQRMAPAYVVSVRVVFRSFMADTDPRHLAVGLYAEPNVIVFPQGTVIVREQIDGSRPRAEVFQQILGMLGELRAAAQDAGIMPDADSGQYGQVSAEQLLDALDAVAERKQVTTVEAVAAENVHTSGTHPFVVRLRVVTSPTGGPGA